MKTYDRSPSSRDGCICLVSSGRSGTRPVTVRAVRISFGGKQYTPLASCVPDPITLVLTLKLVPVSGPLPFEGPPQPESYLIVRLPTCPSFCPPTYHLSYSQSSPTFEVCPRDCLFPNPFTPSFVHLISDRNKRDGV